MELWIDKYSDICALSDLLEIPTGNLDHSHGGIIELNGNVFKNNSSEMPYYIIL